VDGLTGAALGVGLVLSFLLVGQLRLAQASQGHAGFGAVWLLSGYVARVLLLLIAFVAITSSGVADRRALGLTVIAVALGWTVGAVWTWSHWRPLVVDVELPGERTSDPSAPRADKLPRDGRRAAGG
jgi:ABC-type nickel/cobalt efflux system permease component RcnA